MNTLKTNLHARIQALAGAETVIWADQNTPRPALPYWTIRLQAQRMVGRDDRSQGVDVNGIQQVFGVREATLNVQRIGADSEEKVADLRDELGKVTVTDAWLLAKIAVYNIGPVTNVPYEMDKGHLEPRAVLDLFVRYGTELDDEVGVIETVEMAGQYETSDTTPGFDANADLAETISVVL